VLATKLHADGAHRGILCVPGGVRNGQVSGTPFVHMDGQAVFKFAVRVLADAADEALAAASLPRGEIDWLIPHQANLRIMDATAKRLEIPPEKVVVTVDRHANTSAASVPLALDEAVRDGRIRAGHHVMMLGVGGGFTWGAALVRWS
jgi:3-oxoacyl-[acyl-carrier-protein] synthase-3